MIWICGGTGLAGQALADALTERGMPFRSTGRQVDITDEQAVTHALDDVTAVINCAAWTDVDGAEADEEAARRLNAYGPELLARHAARRGVRLIHLSTDYVFGGEAGEPYAEDDPPAPINAYGRTKREGEDRVLTAYPDATVVRTSWLHGAHGPCFVRTILARMAERPRLDVVDDQRGRPTHTRALARALVELLTEPAPSVLHYADAGVTTWFGFATRVLAEARALGWPLACEEIRPVTTDAFPRPAPRPASSALSTERIERLLPWPIPRWEVELARHLSELEPPR